MVNPGSGNSAQLQRAFDKLNRNLDRQLSQGYIIKNFYPEHQFIYEKPNIDHQTISNEIKFNTNITEESKAGFGTQYKNLQKQFASADSETGHDLGSVMLA